MSGNRGFTLIELLVAIVILATGFSVVFEVISRARLDYSHTYELAESLIELNNLLVEGNTEGIKMEKRTLKDYPQVEEVIYTHGPAEIFLYQLKK